MNEASTRLRARLDGLTTDEYPWEPVPAPVTTIAWRLWHIAADCLCGYISPALGDWPLERPATEWYGEVDAALGALDTATAAFLERVTALGEDGISRPLGPDWGPYADDTWAALVVHALDEIAHHGAEIALMRDLYLRLG